MLKFSPAVFAVGDEYQIFAAVSGGFLGNGYKGAL